MTYTDPNKFVQWLKNKDLFLRVRDNYEKFYKVYNEMLNTKRRDEVLIVGDLGLPGSRSSAIMTGCYLVAAKRLGVNYKLVIQKDKKPGQPADDSLVRAFDNLQEESIITLSLSRKLGGLKKLGKSFRKYVKQKRHRFVSTTNLKELPINRYHYMMSAVDVDLKQMQRTALDLQRKLNIGKEVTVTTPKGTSVNIGIRGMRAIRNDGRYFEMGGNVPTGEVYIPPRYNHVNGKIVIDGSVRTREGTILVKKPVSLRIEKGSITDIQGGDEAKKLENTLKWASKKSKHDWGVRRIGELGIGINPKAQIVGPTIINEKAKGTAHFAIGSNAWFGGSIYSIIHLDQVVRHANIFVDGKKLKY